MARAFCIPGIVFLFCAFVLSFLVSISLPFFTAMDFARVNFHSGAQVSPIDSKGVSELRFGIWSACAYMSDGTRTCLSANHAYSVIISNANGTDEAKIASSWTRGLAIHPVATAVTFVALLLSFSQHITLTLLASIVSFLAALLTLIAFAVDIALYAFVHQKMNDLAQVNEDTNTGPGFWLTFVSLILLLLAGCTVCFGRRRDRMSSATPAYPMSSTKLSFWNRIRNRS